MENVWRLIVLLFVIMASMLCAYCCKLTLTMYIVMQFNWGREHSE